MAKVLNPLMSGEARGKFAGAVYNTWRGISIVKVFKAPVKAKTALQLAIMAKMTDISKLFQTLTASQRTAWGVYAANHLRTDWTGNPIRITGANAFTSCNMLAKLAGFAGTSIFDPPSLPSPVFNLATLVATAKVLTITHAVPTTATDSIEARFRSGDSQGRQRALNEMKGTKIFLSNSAASYTLDNAAIAGKATGFYRTISNVTGLPGPWTKQEVTVT